VVTYPEFLKELDVATGIKQFVKVKAFLKGRRTPQGIADVDRISFEITFPDGGLVTIDNMRVMESKVEKNGEIKISGVALEASLSSISPDIIDVTTWEDEERKYLVVP
jgi:hypothetical protein